MVVLVGALARKKKLEKKSDILAPRILTLSRLLVPPPSSSSTVVVVPPLLVVVSFPRDSVVVVPALVVTASSPLFQWWCWSDQGCCRSFGRVQVGAVKSVSN
jgi:hypothetical protein